MVEIKYDRQSRIPHWNQTALSDACVAVIGAGALGNHVCLGLIGLGIGTIKIYDFDDIEAHNLNRQSLFCEEDIGKNKAETLAYRLEKRNSNLMILGINEKIEEDTIAPVLRKVDLVIDCVDRIYVRRMMNRYCLRSNIPLIHGGISWCGGQVGILTRTTPCINCIYPESLQIEELKSVTSCIHKPEPSVVYISQIIAGLMVESVRRALMPFPSEKSLGSQLYKVDFRLDQPFYFEKIFRKVDCECTSILKQVDPSILEQEMIEKANQQSQESLDIASALRDGISF
ncbi:hypothetical protein NEF87_003305 [Candidatus Lokiarchaeum ossiferum]|uniref:THIF-type NAD/FAD binding fold domain-containing protein n=1 Tax=Candidatus Lokiarchaeum ossiferum TaxID=2951803 RepID=A0ABY6HU23_9ARCH|nr:hypothetical protein NEF87_003305 [Candidatus Lokiarchaeum sp. B-35]